MNQNKTVLTKEQKQEFMEWIRNFLHNPRILVMATASDNRPYCNLMCFASTQECSIIVVTPRDTSKYTNLTQNNLVSVLITDSEEKAGIGNTTAITINGRANEVGEKERKKLADIFIAKYPELQDFVYSETSALFRIDPVAIVSPEDFYQVKEVHFE